MATGTMWVISHRKEFWDPKELSKGRTEAVLDQECKVKGQRFDLSPLKGKQIAVLVGERTSYVELCEDYLDVRNNLRYVVGKDKQPVYSQVIGIILPIIKGVADLNVAYRLPRDCYIG
jgi:hypothetical protein